MRPAGISSGTAASTTQLQPRDHVVPLSTGVEATARGDARAQAGRDSSESVDESTNPLSPLPRLGVGSALDLAFDLLRHRLVVLVGLGACFFLPIQLLDLLLRIASRTEWSPESAAVPAGIATLVFGADSGWGWSYLTAGLQAVALAMLGIACGHLIMKLIDKQHTSFRELLVLSLRRAWVAALIVVISLGIRLPLACVPVFGLFVADALLFTAAIVSGAEGLGPLASVGRSVKLSKSALGPAFVVSFGGLCITQLMRLVLYTGPAALLSSFAPPEGLVLLVQQLSSLTLIVLQPLTACIAASGYLMLRTRSEGLDLDLRLVGMVSGAD